MKHCLLCGLGEREYSACEDVPCGPLVCDGLRYLVCGGRDYSDRKALHTALDYLRSRVTIAVIIHGGARGADSMADNWAKAHGIARLPFRANWLQYGPAAGPMRNQRMLDEGKPDVVIAFPGDTGTADMVRRATRALGPANIWKPYA